MLEFLPDTTLDAPAATRIGLAGMRDEGILCPQPLMQAGVSTQLHSYPGTFHRSSLLPLAQASQREAAQTRVALRRGLKIDSAAQAAK